MGKEFELKYAATAADLAAIQATLQGQYTALRMETTYYDAKDSSLSARKWTLRRRLENGVSVCTLKTPAQGLGRNEFECISPSIEAAIPELCKLSNSEELHRLTAGGIVTVCGARFTRLACLLNLEDGNVELALDQGVLFGGGRELSFAEVEVEQKTAGEAATVAFARELAARFGLHPEPKSKFQRGLELAKGV